MAHVLISRVTGTLHTNVLGSECLRCHLHACTSSLEKCCAATSGVLFAWLQLAAPPAAAAGDIADDIDWTEDMPVPVKRRVSALREVQQDYDKLIRQFVRERAELQAKYEQQAGALS